MGSNKNAKMKLIQRYGNIDFLDQLKVKIPKCKHYTSKGEFKRMQQLTYHHILEKSNGGQATIENGALLTAEHHAWFHKQSREVQKQLNNAFQELKNRKDKMQPLPIVFIEPEELDMPFEINISELSIDNEGSIHTYNRTQQKRETQKLLEEYKKEQDDYDRY